MSVPLPNLDDRRWIDLVEEGRSLLPFYAPEWTDHNIHDPGITILELFAAIAEMDIYQLNRIPLERKLKFLALIGVYPRWARPSRAILSFVLNSGVDPILLPPSVQVEGEDINNLRSQFRTLDPVTLIANELVSIQVKDDNGFYDLTARWRRGVPIQLLGENPAVGTTLYLGFAEPLPVNTPVALFFAFGDLFQLAEEEERLRQEIERCEAACRPPRKFCPSPCDELEDAGEQQQPSNVSPNPLSHYSVNTVWEFRNSKGQWQRLDASKHEVSDGTRAFTLNATVTIKVPGQMGAAKAGLNKQPLFYVRCRVSRGVYDAAPLLTSVSLNTVLAEQSIPLATELTIRKGVVAGVGSGAHSPTPWDQSSFVLELVDDEKISALEFVKLQHDLPAFRVLRFMEATNSDDGALSFEGVVLGRGTGEPSQTLFVSQRTVVAESFRLFTLEAGEWHEWILRRDFDGSDRDDKHFRLDRQTKAVLFGDGENGRVPPLTALVVATGYETRAQEGNLAVGAINHLTDNLHNRALLPDFDQVSADLALVTNSFPTTGGDDAETLEEATERARQLIENPTRAVTLGDYETLAKETPGVRVARVSARANLHPGFPCFSAPGMITLIVLPELPVTRPVPSPALRQAISAYLRPRRIIGTRVEVVGPVYRKISVVARVQSAPGVNTANLQTRIKQRIDSFFDPLSGGPDGTGWPFGRDVYRSEVLQVIDETRGVENVLSLELVAEAGRPQCNNICIGPIGLVDSGEHEIEVV
jgi:hypothetical protein